MSAARAGSERRGINTGPGGLGRALPGSRARPANLQYVQPQYRASTPLPGGGATRPTNPQEIAGYQTTINEEVRTFAKGAVADKAASPPTDHAEQTTADIEAGLTRYVNSFKVTKKENIFADYVGDEDLKQSENGVAPNGTVATGKEASATEIMKTSNVMPPDTEDKQAQEKKENSQSESPPSAPRAQAAPLAQPQLPKSEERPQPVKQPESNVSPKTTQAASPEPKKGGCCVIQ